MTRACPNCKGTGRIELEHGLINVICKVCCGKGTVNAKTKKAPDGNKTDNTRQDTG